MNATHPLVPRTPLPPPGSPLKAYWAWAVLNHTPGALEVFFTIGAQVLGYWVPAAVFLAIDLNFPAFSNRHKLQSERRQPSWKSIRHCIRTVARGFALSTALQLAVFACTPNRRMRTPYRVSAELPSLAEFAAHFGAGVLMREVLFYATHRMFHHPVLYARFHKKHHLFTAPMAFASQFAHPVEHIVSNIMPIILPMAVMNVHVLTYTAFLFFELLESTSVHSGYDFALARMHDRHHEKFRVNYGTVGLLDWLMGTNKVGWDKMSPTNLREMEKEAELERRKKNM